MCVGEAPNPRLSWHSYSYLKVESQASWVPSSRASVKYTPSEFFTHILRGDFSDCGPFKTLCRAKEGSASSQVP
jgi:hypothetical protein